MSMMPVTLIRIIGAISFVFFTQMGVWGFEKTGPVDFTLEPILSSEWVCYVHDGDLFIKTTGAAPLKVRGSKDATGIFMSPSLSVAGDSIFVAWIERGSGSNKVLFAASHDTGKTMGKTMELAPGTKATQVRLLADSEGNLYLIEASSGRKPEVTMHFSMDWGETFRSSPLEIDGFEFLYNPTSVVIKDALYLFFYGVKEGKKQMGVKPFKISSLKPMGYTILKETEEVSFNEAFVMNNRPAVIYKTALEGKFVLEGAVKGDEGWEAFSIKNAEGLDVARMDYQTWEGGRVLVVFSGEERERFKQRIYAAVSEDAGRNWAVKRIDNKAFDNTRSWLPRMAADGDKVIVVWEDARDIRSGVRMKLSPDRGRTWVERDVPLSNNKYYAFRPRISFARGTFYVAWDQFSGDERKLADLVTMKLTWAEAVKMTSRKDKMMSFKKKEALLRERVNAYWKGMLRRNLKVTYEIHDPFYRARMPFDFYAPHRGRIVYHSYSIEDLKVEGNVAKVKLKVKYEVPKITILGKETSIPAKEDTAEDTYLFIDGKWFKKFVDTMSGGSAIDY